MRQWIAVLAALSVIACNESATQVLDEGPLRFDKALAKVYCQTEIGFNPSPCVTYGAASHMDYADSGRVVFVGDGTFQWKLSTHKYQCPCYLGGCSDPCYHAAPTVSERSGTYVAAGDSIVLTFAQGEPQLRVLRNSTAFPASSTGYAGPESLTCLGCSVFYPVVFKLN